MDAWPIFYLFPDSYFHYSLVTLVLETIGNPVFGHSVLFGFNLPPSIYRTRTHGAVVITSTGGAGEQIAPYGFVAGWGGGGEVDSWFVCITVYTSVSTRK